MATTLVTMFGQQATGTFNAQTVPGTNHCGKDDGPAAFEYTVYVPFRKGCDVLDTSGFLLDNLYFQQYFNSLPPITLSCEKLARQAGHHFCEVLGDRARMVEYVAVRIHPFAGVWVEARVHPPNQITCEVQA